jgi:hypothetical protein
MWFWKGENVLCRDGCCHSWLRHKCWPILSLPSIEHEISEFHLEMIILISARTVLKSRFHVILVTSRTLSWMGTRESWELCK